MHIDTKSDDRVLNSLNAMEARRYQTDLACRSITELEVIARREKTERLRIARSQSSTKNQ